jgi:peptidoglycan/xylan/chitin deacetylase (PgdA/CDA1 family)
MGWSASVTVARTMIRHPKRWVCLIGFFVLAVAIGFAQVIWNGQASSEVICLTLDDGYNYDPRILDFLEAHGITGTAFLNGEVVETNPDLAKRLHRLGWEVGPHTYNHVNVSTLSYQELEANIRANRDIIFDTIGVYPRWFRPSYGISTAASEAIALQLGMGTVLFLKELSTGDFIDEWSLEYKLERMAGIISRIKPGDIILAHFGERDSYELIHYTVTALLKKGFSFGTVSEVMNLSPQGNDLRISNGLSYHLIIR